MILLRRSRDSEERGQSVLLAVPAAAASGDLARVPTPAPVPAPAPEKAVRKKATPAKPKADPMPKKAAGATTKAVPKAASAAAKPAIDDSAPLAATTTAAAARAAAKAKSAENANTFGKAPAKGVQRYTMGYRHVRISDAPDDVRSRELGRLDRGDEVELVDSFEGFLQVRTPDGVVGWIPRQTIV
jgi:hypothetical protein